MSALTGAFRTINLNDPPTRGTIMVESTPHIIDGVDWHDSDTNSSSNNMVATSDNMPDNELLLNIHDMVRTVYDAGVMEDELEMIAINNLPPTVYPPGSLSHNMRVLKHYHEMEQAINRYDTKLIWSFPMGRQLVHICFTGVEDNEDNDIFKGPHIVGGRDLFSGWWWITRENHYISFPTGMEDRTMSDVHFLSVDIEEDIIFLLDKRYPGDGAAH